LRRDVPEDPSAWRDVLQPNSLPSYKSNSERLNVDWASQKDGYLDLSSVRLRDDLRVKNSNFKGAPEAEALV
jgi:hypothetical protein